MKRAALVACVAAAGAALGASAPASATTFCVPAFHPACPDNGTNVAEPSIEAAMGTSGSDGVADLVLVGPQEVSDPGSIEPQGTDPLTVRGAGAALTTLTTTSNANIVVVNLDANANTRNVTLEDLEVALPASMPANSGTTVQLSNDTLRDVRIVSRNPGSSGSNGVIGFIGGGTISGAEFDEEAGGDMNVAIQSFAADSGPVVIEDTLIDSPVTAIEMSDPGGTVLARRIRIATPEQISFASSAGTLIVQNAIVYTQTNHALSVHANTSNEANLIADHVTGVNLGNSNVSATISDTTGNGNANLTVTNSLFRGYGFGWQRQVTAGTGQSNTTIRYSNLLQAGASAGAGVLTTSNNITANPLFTSLIDLHLNPGSPSIDAGDPAAGGLLADIDGALRPQDGDDNGSAVRDQGAYEFPDPTPPVDPPDPPADAQAPDTSIDSGPGKRKKLSKRRATFAFSANEAGSTFACKLDKAGFAPCASPVKYKRLKRGRHMFSVRATDTAGNVDASPASKRFKVKKKRKR